jgi:hypothetical protein
VKPLPVEVKVPMVAMSCPFSFPGRPSRPRWLARPEAVDPHPEGADTQ